MKTKTMMLILVGIVCVLSFACLVSADGVPQGMISIRVGDVSGWLVNNTEYVLCNYSNSLNYSYVPDLSSSFVVGYNSSDADYDTLGETGGEKTHVLTIAELASHTHTYNTVIGLGATLMAGTALKTTSTNTGSTGSDAAHENRPPYYVVAFICKVGNATRCNSTNVSFVNNIVHATGTNETNYNSTTGLTVYNNWTGNQSGLVLIENIVNAVGTHEYNWNPLLGVNGEWWVWANYTGVGGGSSGSGLLVDNPNPANNSMSQTGVYLNNHIMNKPGGLSCAVDIRFQNFTELSEANLGTGILTENYTITDSDDYIELFIPHAKGQTFTMKQTCVLNKVMLSVYKDVGATGTLDVTLHTLTGPLDDLHFSNNLSTGSLDIGSVPLVSAYVNITMTPYVLQNGTKYCIRVSNPGGDDVTPLNIWWNQDTFGSYSDGGYVEYLPMFPSGVFAELARDGMFGIWCWSFGDNITWDHVINLTFKSNSSGTWQQFGKVYALWNGTWSCFNANFSHNNTKYNWSVIPDINGTNYSEQFYTFTTGTNSGLIFFPISDRLTIGLTLGGISGGILGVAALPKIKTIISTSKKKKQDQTI